MFAILRNTLTNLESQKAIREGDGVGKPTRHFARQERFHYRNIKIPWHLSTIYGEPERIITGRLCTHRGNNEGGASRVSLGGWTVCHVFASGIPVECGERYRQSTHVQYFTCPFRLTGRITNKQTVFCARTLLQRSSAGIQDTKM